MSERYNEYLTDTESYLEPDRTVDILPDSLSCLFPFLDTHIDDFTIQFQNKRNRTVNVLKEGIQITSEQFWEVYNQLKTDPAYRYITTTKSESGKWYLTDKIKRRK